MANGGSGLSVTLRQPGPIALDMAFSCAAGELIALIGPSGAGKTTVLRAIAGIYRSTSGQIRCAGETWFDSDAGVNWPSHQRRVGLVFQAYALFPHLTALGNVEAALGQVPRNQRRQRAEHLLGMVNLDGFGARRPAELSGGQQQRVALARALAREPEVLLLDEPFSAVDRRTRRILRDELIELRRTVRAPIILVTHDIDEAAAMADRLIVIDAGMILQQGPAAELLALPASDRVRTALDLEPHP